MTNPINLSLASEQKDRAIYITATWDASPSANVDHYLLQFKQTAETAWDSLYVDSSPGVFAVEGGYTYDVRVAAVGTDMTKSGFVRDEIEVTAVELDITTSNGQLIVGDVQLTGTISTTSGSTTVTGTGTKFSRQLKTAQTIKFEGEEKTISSITSDTALTLAANAEATNTDVDYYLTNMIVLKGDVWIARGEDKIYFQDSNTILHDQTGGLIGDRVEFNNDVGNIHTQLGFAGGEAARLFLDSYNTSTGKRSYTILQQHYNNDYVYVTFGIPTPTGYTMRFFEIYASKIVTTIPKLQLGSTDPNDTNAIWFDGGNLKYSDGVDTYTVTATKD